MRKTAAAVAIVCLWAAGAAGDDAGGMRVWRDASAQHETRASLVEAKYSREAKDLMLTLKKEDGTTISVAFKRLSDEDQRFVRQALQARKAAEPKPKPSPAKAKSDGGAVKKRKAASPGNKGTEAAEAEIEKALADATQLEFIKTPLVDVIDYLKDRHKIEIQLDKKAIEDCGVSFRTPVTKNIKGVSLRAALKVVLQELGLTYTVHDGVLLITSPECAEGMLITKVYPVTDLVVQRDRFGRVSADPRGLVDQIVRIVAPASWDVAGGLGSLSASQVGGVVLLSVAQSYEVQQEVQALLAKLRQAAQPAKR
jgi:hypothetical protein